jgi:phosphoglycolate phosphatase-like HAD superfamily hydrolase
MHKKAIIIDLDNTLIDTAQRKHSILKEFMPNEVISEKKVKEDFDLVSILGTSETEVHKSFFKKLDSENGIKKHVAPLFPDVLKFIKKHVNEGNSIILLTERPINLKDVTIEELKNIGLDGHISELHMYDNNFSNVADFKKTEMKLLTQRFDVIASIGDRPDDMESAKIYNIPFVLMRTTLPSEVILDQTKKNGSWRAICNSWNEIDIAIDIIIEGRKKMVNLRDQFTESYSKWLADLDNKSRVVATIATLLATLTGKIVIDKSQSIRPIDYIMGVAFVLSIFSLLYSIRSLTSRRTSGPNSGFQISTSLKQLFSILFGKPQKWLYKEGDPIDYFEKFKKYPEEEKARSHYNYFFEQYNTYDPESISNHRLFELRATNYSKLYPERIASILLMFAIVLIVVWLFPTAIQHHLSDPNLNISHIKP